MLCPGGGLGRPPRCNDRSADLPLHDPPPGPRLGASGWHALRGSETPGRHGVRRSPPRRCWQPSGRGSAGGAADGACDRADRRPLRDACDPPRLWPGSPPNSPHGTYPSGGCERVVLFYGLIAYLAWRQASGRRATGIWARVGVAVLAFNEAYSRSYLTLHWFTDAIAVSCTACRCVAFTIAVRIVAGPVRLADDWVEMAPAVVGSGSRSGRMTVFRGGVTAADRSRAAFLDEVCATLWPEQSGETGRTHMLLPGRRRPRLVVPRQRRVAAAAVRLYGEPRSRHARLATQVCRWCSVRGSAGAISEIASNCPRPTTSRASRGTCAPKSIPTCASACTWARRAPIESRCSSFSAGQANRSASPRLQ